jgi:hypothetical protein
MSACAGQTDRYLSSSNKENKKRVWWWQFRRHRGQTRGISTKERRKNEPEEWQKQLTADAI